jgi:hypothetical protein
VIVEPPSTSAPALMSATAARAIPSTSTPPCSKNRLSSIAIVALRSQSDMSPAPTGSRFFSAGMEPSSVPSAA